MAGQKYNLYEGYSFEDYQAPIVSHLSEREIALAGGLGNIPRVEVRPQDGRYMDLGSKEAAANQVAETVPHEIDPVKAVGSQLSAMSNDWGKPYTRHDYRGISH